MKTEFKSADVYAGRGCYSREQVSELSFITKDVIHIHDIINSEIPLRDKFWFIRRNCDLTTEQFRSMAVGVATIVLPIYEDKYPNNTAPREAIKAAQDYLNGDINIDTLSHKRADAADAACAAARTADARTAAACAAYAACADAADAADAACDAAAYTADVNYTKQLKDFLILFTSI